MCFSLTVCIQYSTMKDKSFVGPTGVNGQFQQNNQQALSEIFHHGYNDTGFAPPWNTHPIWWEPCTRLICSWNVFFISSGIKYLECPWCQQHKYARPVNNTHAWNIVSDKADAYILPTGVNSQNIWHMFGVNFTGRHSHKWYH